jgi:hypothetical protein
MEEKERTERGCHYFIVHSWPSSKIDSRVLAFIFHVPGLKPPPLGGQL